MSERVDIERWADNGKGDYFLRVSLDGRYVGSVHADAWLRAWYADPVGCGVIMGRGGYCSETAAVDAVVSAARLKRGLEAV